MMQLRQLLARTSPPHREMKLTVSPGVSCCLMEMLKNPGADGAAEGRAEERRLRLEAKVEELPPVKLAVQKWSTGLSCSRVRGGAVQKRKIRIRRNPDSLTIWYMFVL